MVISSEGVINKSENLNLKIKIEIVANLASHPVRSLWCDVLGKLLQGDSEIGNNFNFDFQI